MHTGPRQRQRREHTPALTGLFSRLESGVKLCLERKRSSASGIGCARLVKGWSSPKGSRRSSSDRPGSGLLSVMDMDMDMDMDSWVSLHAHRAGLVRVDQTLLLPIKSQITAFVHACDHV